MIAWFVALPASDWLAFDALRLDRASQLGQAVARAQLAGQRVVGILSAVA
jgi:hypothetical protein